MLKRFLIVAVGALSTGSSLASVPVFERALPVAVGERTFGAKTAGIDEDSTQGEVGFSGEIRLASCRVGEMNEGRFVQMLPVFVGLGVNVKRIDNYVIQFSSCPFDHDGLPFADIYLTEKFQDWKRRFSSPSFKLISHGDAAVDSINVPLSNDTDTIVNIALPNGTLQPGLLYLRAYYPFGNTAERKKRENVTVEVNYK